MGAEFESLPCCPFDINGVCPRGANYQKVIAHMAVASHGGEKLSMHSEAIALVKSAILVSSRRRLLPRGLNFEKQSADEHPT